MGEKYAVSVRVLHWLIGLCVICLILAGLALRYDVVPDAWHHKLNFLHVSVGLTVLGLMVLRVALRLANKPPPLPKAIAGPERVAAGANHLAFYVAVLAMPVFGILFEQAHGRAVTWFGVVALPSVIAKNEAAHDLFYGLHFWVGLGLIALILLHVAAVVRHHRAGVPILRRMWR